MRNRDYWILLHSERIGLTGGSMETRVTLRPGEKGTKALVTEYGHRLIYVRYRYDAAARMRYKTVELVVEQVPWEPREFAADPGGRLARPPSLVGVRVAYEDRALQQQIRQAGGRWVTIREMNELAATINVLLAQTPSHQRRDGDVRPGCRDL